MSERALLMSIREAQEALGGVSRGTIYNLIHDGSLVPVKVRRRTFLRVSDIRALAVGTSRPKAAA